MEEQVRPVRVAVPSRSLRRHLLREVARRRGAVVGLEIVTLYGLALEIVTRRSVPPQRADAGFELLVCRHAGEMPVLRAGLEGLADGYDAVVAAVRDLLDAGFLPGNEEGVLERLDDVAGEVASERVERARALVRLASAAFEAGEAAGMTRSMRALQIAEEVLSLNGPEVLPTRALFVYGFADVTGVAADLLVTLIRTFAATVLLDRPPDPADSDREDTGGAYLSRLEERVGHLDSLEDAGVDQPPRVRLVEAPDREAEARWAAESVRQLLDAGAEAERIGVVGRSLEAAALPLRRHLRRLGVPFSGEGATVPGAGPLRRLRRLVDLLQRGPSCEIDLWLEARSEHERATELLLGLRVLGVSRVADLAALEADAVTASGVALPLAVETDDAEAEDLDSPPRLPRAVLTAATAEAERLVDVMRRWPATATAAVHQLCTLDLLEALAWLPTMPAARAVRESAAALHAEFPADFEVAADEWRKLLGGRLEGAGDVAIGGRGAGVQVLTVMESRARTFEHLFVVGANRGIFPRVVNEDPMLAEAVRARLASDVLPEMPVKGRGADEERYLFAQLMSSAPDVAVSWHAFGLNGTMTPSPFVDRLRSAAVGDEVGPVPPLWSLAGCEQRARTAYELVVGLAAGGASADLAPMLAAAVEEGREDASAAWMRVAPEAVSAARLDVLSAVERSPTAADPLPWFGLTGAEPADDRPLWVTHAEAIATCPWRAFVERRLRVLPMPDPLLGLPGIEGPLVGRVVHEVLDAVAADSVAREGLLEEAADRVPASIAWPAADALDGLVAAASTRVATRAGLAPVGMAPLLAARARELLEVARSLEWERGPVGGVVGTEMEGTAEVAGRPGRLAFRADRVDRRGNGLELVDYKTGAPLSDAKGEAKRREHLQMKVARGRVLQAAAYACAEGVGRARGRYLYLKPHEEWSDEVREVVVDGSDDELRGVFSAAVATIAEANARGVAFPRVEEADGRTAAHCQYCAVAEACRRDDSRFRLGLVAWMNRSVEGVRDGGAAAARELWWLGFKRPGDGT